MKTTIITTRPFIPSQDEVDQTSEAGANPRLLCANWRCGCNGVTNGPIEGRLTLCDYCEDGDDD